MVDKTRFAHWLVVCSERMTAIQAPACTINERRAALAAGLSLPPMISGSSIASARRLVTLTIKRVWGSRDMLDEVRTSDGTSEEARLVTGPAKRFVVSVKAQAEKARDSNGFLVPPGGIEPPI